MPKLSIITVAYQSADKLAGFLTSARFAAPDAEYVVVDNASTDDTANTARQNGAHQVVVGSTNVGFGRACNLGVEHSSGDWLLFANPDLTIESIPAVSQQDQHPFGIAGGWLAERGNGYRPSLRSELTFPEEALSQLLYRFIPQRFSRFAPQRRWPARWASGALLLCRRSEFLELRGFDPRFFLYFEDRDLAARYRHNGYPLRIDSGLRGSHGHGESSPTVQSWIREAWSLTSWIEYRGIWHGSAAARRTARLTLSTLSTISRLDKQIQGNRANKKATEAAQIVSFLCKLQQHLEDMPNFHPFARAALSNPPSSSRH